MPAERVIEVRSAPVIQASRGTGSSGVFIGASGAGMDCFDGKINSPLLFSRPLQPLEAFSLALQPNRVLRSPDLAAYWDFSRSIAGTRILDAFAAPSAWRDLPMPREGHDRMALGGRGQ